MIDAALIALEESPLSQKIAASRYVYPVLNAIHILGLTTLFGSILALDLRPLGAFSRVSVHPLAQALPRVAASGLLVAALAGFLLFSVEPNGYAANPAFLLKIALVGVGVSHAVILHMSPAWKALCRNSGTISLHLRFSAALSLLVWMGAIIAGRFIAFRSNGLSRRLDVATGWTANSVLATW